MIFSSGGNLNLQEYSDVDVVKFQIGLFKLQLVLEDIFMEILMIKPGNTSKRALLLCDRGLLDGCAYMSQDHWRVLLNMLGVYVPDIRENRYDLVLHMVTAANGAAQAYNLSNRARHESLEQAVDLDEKLRRAWANHPAHFLISNDVESFESKMKMATNIILQKNGAKANLNYSFRYLMLHPNPGYLFNEIASLYKSEVFTLVDTFIQKTTLTDKNRNSRVVFVRKRQHDFRVTFMKGVRTYMNDGTVTSYKENLHWKNYTAYIEMHKGHSTTLERKRVVISTNKGLDATLIVENVRAGGFDLVTLTVQGNEKFCKSSKEQQYKKVFNGLPLFINKAVVMEVSNTPEFRLENLAEPDWKPSDKDLQNMQNHLKELQEADHKTPKTNTTESA